MRLDQHDRLVAVINLFITNKAYLSVEEISGCLNISKRNVYYTLDEINTILEHSKVSKIHSIYGKGMFIDENQKNVLSKYSPKNTLKQIYSLTQEERLACYYCEMFNNANSFDIHDFDELLKVSRYTVINDINELKSKLSSYHLEIKFTREKGYRIVGNELNRRRGFLNFFGSLYSSIVQEPDMFSRFSFYTKPIIQKYQILKTIENSKYAYYDSSLLSIAYLIAYIAKKNNDPICFSLDPQEQKMIEDSHEQQFVSKHFPQLIGDEFNYITLLLYCSRINQRCESVIENKIMVVTKQMENLFYVLTAINTDDAEFTESLATHLETAFLRMKYGISIDNPLLEEIKQRYSLFYGVVENVVAPLEDMVGGPINESEIGFITLYFAGKAREKEHIVQQVSVIAICLNGLSTSYLLKREIENLDSRINVQSCISLNEYDHGNYHADIILTTVPINSIDNERIIQIHPILTMEDKIAVENAVNQIIFHNSPIPTYSKIVNTIRPYVKSSQIDRVKSDLKQVYKVGGSANLSDVFRPEFVQIEEEKEDDWEKLLFIVGKPLIENGYIGEDYIQELISNIKTYGSYMTYHNGYLLGHASMEKAKRLGLSYLHLRYPVQIMENKIHHILLLTPVDSFSHVNISYKLSDLFDDDKIERTINKAATTAEIFEIVENKVFE